MTRTASVDSRTYLPETETQAQIIDFVKALEKAGGQVPSGLPYLVDSDGTRTEIPPSMVEVLRQVAHSLSQGLGVTVAPMNAMLTTQEAADFLGISRPTLVRILERGDLRMERPARHRYVRLADLLAYQQRLHAQRAAGLDEMARDAVAMDLYDQTDFPPPPMR